jgi:hypothetical protein
MLDLAASRALLELLVHLLDHRLPEADARVNEPVGNLTKIQQLRDISKSRCGILVPS